MHLAHISIRFSVHQRKDPSCWDLKRWNGMFLRERKSYQDCFLIGGWRTKSKWKLWITVLVQVHIPFDGIVLWHRKLPWIHQYPYLHVLRKHAIHLLICFWYVTNWMLILYPSEPLYGGEQTRWSLRPHLCQRLDSSPLVSPYGVRL